MTSFQPWMAIGKENPPRLIDKDRHGADVPGGPIGAAVYFDQFDADVIGPYATSNAVEQNRSDRFESQVT